LQVPIAGCVQVVPARQLHKRRCRPYPSRDILLHISLINYFCSCEFPWLREGNQRQERIAIQPIGHFASKDPMPKLGGKSALQFPHSSCAWRKWASLLTGRGEGAPCPARIPGAILVGNCSALDLDTYNAKPWNNDDKVDFAESTRPRALKSPMNEGWSSRPCSAPDFRASNTRSLRTRSVRRDDGRDHRGHSMRP